MRTLNLGDKVMQGEIVQCPDCGVDLEVVAVESVESGVGPDGRRGLGRVTLTPVTPTRPSPFCQTGEGESDWR